MCCTCILEHVPLTLIIRRLKTQVTIFFSDIVGFTVREAASALLQPFSPISCFERQLRSPSHLPPESPFVRSVRQDISGESSPEEVMSMLDRCARVKEAALERTVSTFHIIACEPVVSFARDTCAGSTHNLTRWRRSTAFSRRVARRSSRARMRQGDISFELRSKPA